MLNSSYNSFSSLDRYVLVGNCIYYYQHEDDVYPCGVMFLTGSFVEPLQDGGNERKGYWGIEVSRNHEQVSACVVPPPPRGVELALFLAAALFCATIIAAIVLCRLRTAAAERYVCTELPSRYLLPGRNCDLLCMSIAPDASLLATLFHRRKIGAKAWLSCVGNRPWKYVNAFFGTRRFAVSVLGNSSPTPIPTFSPPLVLSRSRYWESISTTYHNCSGKRQLLLQNHRRKLYTRSKVEQMKWVKELRKASAVVPIEVRGKPGDACSRLWLVFHHALYPPGRVVSVL